MRNKRHSFGQNFLVDEHCIQVIVDAVFSDDAVNKTNQILEVGPGRGAITYALISKLKEHSLKHVKLDVAEIDYELIDLWKAESSQNGVVRNVYEGDALKNIPSIFEDENTQYTVVSNLPYSSGTAILNELARYGSQIPKMVLMFQKEVALRIMAPPSDSHRGSLSVFIQNQWIVRPLITVKPKSFRPPPKIDSMVLEFFPKETPEIRLQSVDDQKCFDQLLRLSFQHRRKMLRNNLARDAQWQDALIRSEVADTTRAEAMNFDDWRSLWIAYKEKK